MSDRFLKNIEHMLENTRGLSLKVLFEEKEEKSKEKEEKSDDTFDAFSSDDSEDNNDKEDAESIKEPEDESETDNEDNDNVSSQVYDDLHDLSDFTKTVNDANHEKERVKNKFYFKGPKNVVSSSYNPLVKQKSSLTFKNLMLMKEESETDRTLDKVEKSLEDEQERIQKLGDDAHAISAKIKKGHKINFEKEASDALMNFKNFDAKFSKSEIIANMYIDKIAELSSPQDLERNIKDFLIKFNELLPDTNKIDIHEKPTGYNTGTGGKTPSG
jgi:hypothetical protein